MYEKVETSYLHKAAKGGGHLRVGDFFCFSWPKVVVEGRCKHGRILGYSKGGCFSEGLF